MTTRDTFSAIIGNDRTDDAAKSRAVAKVFDDSAAAGELAATRKAYADYKKALMAERKALAMDIISSTDGPFVVGDMLEKINAEVQTGAPDKAKVIGYFEVIDADLKKTSALVGRVSATNTRLLKTFNVMAAAESESKALGGPSADTLKTAADILAQGARILSMKQTQEEQAATIGRLRANF